MLKPWTVPIRSEQSSFQPTSMYVEPILFIHTLFIFPTTETHEVINCLIWGSQSHDYIPGCEQKFTASSTPVHFYQTTQWHTQKTLLLKTIHLLMNSGQCSWLSHYATSQKVVCAIPDEVTGFFNWPNSSGWTMALESSQSLTEMRTSNLPGVQGSWPIRLTTSLPSVTRLEN
jgi:hypothetical protein